MLDQLQVLASKVTNREPISNAMYGLMKKGILEKKQYDSLRAKHTMLFIVQQIRINHLPNTSPNQSIHTEPTESTTDSSQSNRSDLRSPLADITNNGRRECLSNPKNSVEGKSILAAKKKLPHDTATFSIDWKTPSIKLGYISNLLFFLMLRIQSFDPLRHWDVFLRLEPVNDAQLTTELVADACAKTKTSWITSYIVYKYPPSTEILATLKPRDFEGLLRTDFSTCCWLLDLFSSVYREHLGIHKLIAGSAMSLAYISRYKFKNLYRISSISSDDKSLKCSGLCFCNLLNPWVCIFWIQSDGVLKPVHLKLNKMRVSKRGAEVCVRFPNMTVKLELYAKSDELYRILCAVASFHSRGDFLESEPIPVSTGPKQLEILSSIVPDSQVLPTQLFGKLTCERTDREERSEKSSEVLVPHLQVSETQNESQYTFNVERARRNLKRLLTWSQNSAGTEKRQKTFNEADLSERVLKVIESSKLLSKMTKAIEEENLKMRGMLEDLLNS